MQLKRILPVMAMTFVTTAMAQTPLKSGIDVKNMDRSIRPGTDFYEYANKGWMQAHPLTAEYSRYGSFDELAENNRKQLRELIESLAAGKHANGTLAQKIGDLYNLAMDSVRRNREGAAPIQADLQKIYAIGSIQDLQIQMARLGRMGISAFFGIGVGADAKNSARNIVGIGQGGLSLGQREYYLDNDSATVKVRNAFKEYVVKLFCLTGDELATAQKKSEAVMQVETAIAEVSSSRVELRDPEANYHKLSFAQLLTEYPGIDWSTLFWVEGFPAFNEVDLGQPKAIRGVEKIFAELPLETLKTYLAFHYIDEAASSLSDDFVNASFDFYGRVLSGRQENRPLWKRAVGTVEGVLGEAVGKMYVEKYFPAAAKERMTQLIRNLQVALGQRIDAQKWMSAETKQKAHEKLSTFYVKVGYPDKWRNYDALTIDTASFWTNLCRASEFVTDYTIAEKVNKPVDGDEWFMTPQTVNAYYNPTTNEICFPAGILQPPFFDMGADDAFNYGAIGVVIGHEMTHGFDDQGRQFDKDGNLKDWWTKEDGEGFKQRAKVMADFFDKIEVLPGLHANGALTLGENLADHGGLNVAFQAFENATKAAPLPTVDGLTPAQRFFVAYAGVWAGNIRDEQIRVYTKSDPHSLGRWRVNGALPHIDAWYKAFGITKKDPLFIPQNKRVTIW